MMWRCSIIHLTEGIEPVVILVIRLQMMFAPLSLSFLAALLLVQVNAHSHSDELSEQYTYNVQLDYEGRYTMFYSYDTELSILRIAVLVETTGWIGLGISPNGQMPRSDVVMGWVDGNGQAFLQVIKIAYKGLYYNYNTCME